MAKECSVHDFPTAPGCGACVDPLCRACENVTPVPPDLPTMFKPVKTEKVMCGRYVYPRNYYNPARNVVYPRYPVCDWDASAKMHMDSAHRESKVSQKLDASCWQVLNGLEARTLNRQCSNTKKLATRSFEISFWKEQLVTEVNAMNVSITNLAEAKRVAEKFLADIRIPLEIAEECLLQREKRVGIDQCHDDTEKCLSKEVLIIRRVQATIKKLVEQAMGQLRVDKCVQTAIDVDVRDKNHSQNIDDRLHQLRNSSCGMSFHPGIELIDNTVIDKKAWVEYTHQNILRSTKERSLSDKLRNQLDAYLRSAAIELHTVYSQTNHVLSTRIRETTDIKNKMQDHLNQIVNDIREIDRKIDLLRKSIADKNASIMVAQTRLEERTRKLNLELVQDEPNKGLKCEMGELYNTIRQLTETLHECELAMTRLVKIRRQLLAEIAIKENTIQIDQRCVAGRRKSMPMDPGLGPLLKLDKCPDPCT